MYTAQAVSPVGDLWHIDEQDRFSKVKEIGRKPKQYATMKAAREGIAEWQGEKPGDLFHEWGWRVAMIEIGEPCIICGKPAHWYYQDDPSAPSCGRVGCDLQIQTGMDYADEHRHGS